MGINCDVDPNPRGEVGALAAGQLASSVKHGFVAPLVSGAKLGLRRGRAIADSNCGGLRRHRAGRPNALAMEIWYGADPIPAFAPRQLPSLRLACEKGFQQEKRLCIRASLEYDGRLDCQLRACNCHLENVG